MNKCTWNYRHIKGKKVTQTFPTKDKFEIRREKYCEMLKCNTSVNNTLHKYKSVNISLMFLILERVWWCSGSFHTLFIGLGIGKTTLCNIMALCV